MVRDPEQCSTLRKCFHLIALCQRYTLKTSNAVKRSFIPPYSKPMEYFSVFTKKHNQEFQKRKK